MCGDSVSIEQYKERFLAKLDSMSDEELRQIFDDVLRDYSDSVSVMGIPVIFPTLSQDRTYIFLYKRGSMLRKRGNILEVCRNQGK